MFCHQSRQRGGIEPLHVPMPRELKSRPSTSPTHPGFQVSMQLQTYKAAIARPKPAAQAAQKNALALLAKPHRLLGRAASHAATPCTLRLHTKITNAKLMSSAAIPRRMHQITSGIRSRAEQRPVSTSVRDSLGCRQGAVGFCLYCERQI